MKELHTTLEGHIRTEETQMWPEIRQFWGEEKINQLGGQVQAAKAAGSVGATVSGAAGSAVQAVKDAAQSVTGH